MRLNHKSSENITSNKVEHGVDFAWKTHSAITDWTAKVDTKASIVLSLGGVLLGFFVALSTKDRLLQDLSGWRLFVGRTGLGCTSFGVLLAALVVMPRLNRRKTRKSWKSNYIYFGHLRKWDPAKLKRKLQNQTVDEQLDMLSNQLVNTADIAWKKHGLLQFSMVALLSGVILVSIAVIWPK